jgi:hypothetical protein
VTDRRLSITRIANNRVPMTLEDGGNQPVHLGPTFGDLRAALEVSLPNVDHSGRLAGVALQPIMKPDDMCGSAGHRQR